MEQESPYQLTIWHDRLQILITALVVFGYLRGEMDHGLLIGIWLTLPMGRYSASSEYRHRWEQRFAQARSRFAAYSRGSGELPWRAALLYVVLPVLVLSLANGRKLSSADNLPINLTAASIALEGNAELSEYTEAGDPDRESFPGELPYSIVETESGLRSMYPVGNLIFAVPVYTVSRLIGGQVQNRKPQWRLAKWIGASLTALSAGLLLLMALQIVDRRAALFIAWMFGMGSAGFSTLGQGLWSQTGATFLMLAALFIEFRAEDPRSWSARQTNRRDALQGFILGSLFAVRLTSATFLLPFGLWLFVRSPRRALRVVAIALLAFLPWALYQHAAYDNWLGPQMMMGEDRFESIHFGSNLAGLLVSPGRGLFVFQPWLLLPLALLFWPTEAPASTRAGSGAPRGWAWFCAAAIALQLALVASWDMWWGGHGWGSRMLVESIPLCALLIAPAVARLVRDRMGRRLVTAATLAGFLMQVNSVFGRGYSWTDDPVGQLTPLEERLWDWSAPPFLYPLLRPEAPEASE